MPSIRHTTHKATATSKKNIYMADKMNVLLRKVLKEFSRADLLLWREVYKRKQLNPYHFEEDIKKGEKALNKDLVKKLDEELDSKRKINTFFRIVERRTGVKKLYSMDKEIEKTEKANKK